MKPLCSTSGPILVIMKVDTLPPAILLVAILLFFLEIVAAHVFETTRVANDEVFLHHHIENLQVRKPEYDNKATDGYGLPPPYGPITSESSADNMCEYI